tara:strand:- start:1388 stop:1861 length:474 start_codon:yes stop_codon:yes gene_type:complete
VASKIKKGTLTVRISEDVVLNGQQQGGTNILTIPSINETSKRILTITTSKHDVMSFSSIVGKGNYSLADMRYIRFTNLDDTNHLFLIFKNEDNDEFIVKLDKGQSFIYNGDLAGGTNDTMEALTAGTASVSNVGYLLSVSAQADTASCDMELFIASA